MSDENNNSKDKPQQPDEANEAPQAAGSEGKVEEAVETETPAAAADSEQPTSRAK